MIYRLPLCPVEYSVESHDHIPSETPFIRKKIKGKAREESGATKQNEQTGKRIVMLLVPSEEVWADSTRYSWRASLLQQPILWLPAELRRVLRAARSPALSIGNRINRLATWEPESISARMFSGFVLVTYLFVFYYILLYLCLFFNT